MGKGLFILEHEILKAILEKNSITIGKPYVVGTKQMPILGRDYNSCSLHFGTLVDILNNPKKYANEKSLAGKEISRDDVKINKYSWGEVLNAIEVLIHNQHVKDIIDRDKDRPNIVITTKGAIDFRASYYLKEYDKILSIERNYEIQKRDLLLKKYWYLVEAAKYVLGGVIGAAITWFFTHR